MPEVITDNLDLWSSALLTRSTAGRGNNGKLEAYGIKKLRELILELAVRGKLVPQDANDEPSSVLLERVAKEKVRLIKAGKIKQEKPFPEVDVDDTPYVIPANWEWARLPNIASYKPGKTPSTKNPSYWSENPDDIPWVSISDMEHLGVLTETSKKITPEAAKNVFGYEPIPKGSLLMSFKLTVGKMAILGMDAYHNEAILSIQPYSGILRDYLLKVLPTRAQAGNTKRAIMGDTLNSTSLALLLIPVPPLAEQQRIVAKVDELMALCDQLEQQQTHSIEAHQTLVASLLGTLTRVESQQEFNAAWARIASHFDTLFITEASIDQLKQTILQLAVMGKLVPQDPNDEPASALLKKIAGEKEKLLKKGASKKATPLLEIEADEKPFEVPGKWKWARLGWLVNFKSELVKPEDYADFEQVAPDSIEKGTGKLLCRRTVSESGIRGPNNRFYAGQILYSKIRPSLSKAIIAPFDGLCSADMYPLEAMIDAPFLLKAILSEPFLEQVRIAENRIKMPKLNVDSLSHIVVPLPPLAEQHRIVAKVDELMALCDTLKARLADAQAIQLHLADAIVEQAVC